MILVIYAFDANDILSLSDRTTYVTFLQLGLREKTASFDRGNVLSSPRISPSRFSSLFSDNPKNPLPRDKHRATYWSLAISREAAMGVSQIKILTPSVLAREQP